MQPQGTENFGPVVYGFVRSLAPRVVLETGCHLGGLTRWICSAVAHNGHGRVYAIDDWSNTDVSTGSVATLEGFTNEILADPTFAGLVEVKSGRTVDVEFPRCIDMAVLDSAHDEATVRSEAQRALAAGCRCLFIVDCH